MNHPTIHPDVSELAELLRPDWDQRLAAIPSWHPRNETGGGAGGGGGGEGGGSGGGGGEGGGGSGSGSGSGAGEGGGGGQGSGSGDTYTPPDQGAWNDAQRQLREAREERDRLKNEADARERQEAEDQGKYKELAEKEKARADAADEKLAQRDRTDRVEKIARRLKFRDPSDVMHRLSDDDLADDGKVEKALKALAESKKYLVEDGETPRTRDVTGDAGGSGSGGGGGGGSAPGAVGVGRLAAAYGERSSGG